MQTRRLGDSDLHITPIGFGAWAIGGGGWAFGWGAQDDADSVASIREALDLGVNWVDTAAVYGLGHSEQVVAKAVAGVARRPYVFTKCARVWDEHRQIGKSLAAASIRRECEASLRRLQVDVIDLYQIHWPEPPEDIDEGWLTARTRRGGRKRMRGEHGVGTTKSRRVAAERWRPPPAAAAHARDEERGRAPPPDVRGARLPTAGRRAELVTRDDRSELEASRMKDKSAAALVPRSLP